MTTQSFLPRSGLVLLCLCLASSLAIAAPDSQETPPGVVVETVENGFAAQKAGLQPGDILLRWERAASPPANPEPASGDLRSPRLLYDLEVEQAPRGELTLSVARGSSRLHLHLPPTEWRLEARPRMASAELDIYQKGAALIDRDQRSQALDLWRELANDFERDERLDLAGWLFLKIGKTASGSRDWEVANRAFEEALRTARAEGDEAFLAAILEAEARSLRDRSQLESAAAMFAQALEIRRRSGEQSLAVAAILQDLGVVSWFQGDLPSAGSAFRDALEIRQKLAPSSRVMAASLNTLGLVKWKSGDLETAETLYRRSFQILEELEPASLPVAHVLNNLGLVAWQRTDLVAAEDFFLRSLNLQDRLAPGTIEVARNLNNLGNVASTRGNLDGAEAFYRRALALKEKLTPKSVEHAASLANLGLLLEERGDLATAEELTRRALAIQETLAPESLDLVGSLITLGSIALKRRELTAAERYFARALTITEHLAPRSFYAANSLHLLGEIALARSDLNAAEDRFKRTLALRQERTPGTMDEAECCHQLARIYRRRRESAKALDSYRCAVAALEAQKSKLGGSDAIRSKFGATYADIYTEAIDLMVKIGNHREAFDLLERYRARELLTLLSGRDLAFSDLPEDLRHRRRTADLEYERAYTRWLELSDRTAAEEQQRVRDELERARQQQDRIRAEVRLAAPRLADLQDPQPLGLDAVRAVLDPGTLLLSFSIGADGGYLFAVGPTGDASDGLEVFALAPGRESLQGEVERFRDRLSRGRVDRRLEKTLLQARSLSDQLLAPAAGRIARAERLLILADGSLHALPFGALADPAADGVNRFLAEAKPIHHAASATVFSLLKATRREARPVELTAFGDPLYPRITTADEAAAPRLRAALKNGLDLAPLPATREEVTSLGRLFPGASSIYVGAEATEPRVKAVNKTTTHLHIASHGLLDDRFPLESALAFSIPRQWREGEDNGLLQAWEIFEQLRIDADLVTLSACDTGLGKVLGGEGLMGLTRAFQYAGARSVLASLWSVGDDSTAHLMGRFYTYLKQGRSKAGALRAAQLDLLAGGGTSHPFHWAGFELVGDWR